DHMRVLLNEQATLENLRSALFEFLRRAIDTDFVSIYFSGHGTPEPGNPNNLYLLTYDSDPNKLATTAFPMWDVNPALSRHITAKKVVIFTDECHSGGVLATGIAEKGFVGGKSNLINRYLADLANAKEGVVVFTASQAGEVSQEREDLGHGVFTYYLLEGLRGKAELDNDYTVTVGELMDYVEDQVKRETNGNQRPLRSATVFDYELPMSVLPH
ncbi:MAG: caspase family protein, partial [Bacteroidota bacterium]